MLEATAPPPDPASQPVAPPAPAEHHMSFREVLSALNPLQYLPVIGTIYRAITGDQIPEAVRDIGSIIVGGLIGGPIGALLNIGMIAGEKITGIDLDKVGQKLLAGSASDAHPVANPTPTPAPLAARASTAAPTPTARSPATTPTGPWSPAQLAAYGVSTAVDGTLRLAGLSGADVLNSLELSRLQVAQTAYGRAAGLAS
jgi:hypothetical protein